MKSIKKYIYITVGLISVVLGAIGVVLPIFPTTPFLLLASYCFAKGSDRFNTWFIGTKLYKNHLESFVKERTMTLKEKICILAFADFMLAFPLILIDSLFMKGVIVVLILFKFYYFIFRIKTITAEEKAIRKLTQEN
ncbi:YbaN family protein [Clostridium sp. DSM 100503]|uniref:YbaN family protein n=1 Tax=Clostridium sp. DSM 100503 TaxID=2963282 RepID=UPI002149F255|nr:YbaN family protein [Clostridium sp. DSM 100503]MCR1952439.1 YbaN family protein [Clostridium sp. DSM 100503]